MSRIGSFALALTLVTTAGCSRKADTPPSGQAASDNAAPEGPSPTEQARTIFNTICATCHGPDGMGNGPGAAALNPKPRNYTDKAWQASVTDDQIKKTILMGGAAVGKSPAMPSQPQLKDKPEVVDALVRIIRTFGK